jgi:hypothetical protein
VTAGFVYHDVPAAVSRITAYRWQPGGPPVPLAIAVAHEGADVRVTFTLKTTVIVMLARGDEAYLLDGPAALEDDHVERTIDRVWRHTLGGPGGADSDVASSLDWLSANEPADSAWPACSWSAARWECIGVRLDASGVVIATIGDGLLSVVVSGESSSVMRRTRWGRLVVVADGGGDVPPRLRLVAARALSPAARARALRLETSVLADVHPVTVAPGLVWLSGDSSPPDAWIEIRSARSGPEYLVLSDVAEGPALAPIRVALDERRSVVTTVTASRGEPAAGALVTAFRLIDPVPPAPIAGRPPPRRVLAAEGVAEADGTIRLDGLGNADYEIMAWHPQFGRSAIRLERSADRATIRLQPPGVARGRVLVSGKPVARVDVVSVPDPSAYATTQDSIDLKGGDTQTGVDGRFTVGLASGGGGELRVGGGAYAVTRVPLPRTPLPLVDLGDIELARGLTVAVTVDRDLPGCDLRAAGPIGRSGLQIVTATRAGPGLFSLTLPEEGSWEVSMLCGRDERALSPPIAHITADSPHSLTLVVR